MKRLIALPVLLLLLSLGGLAACGGNNTSGTASQLTVENFRFTRLEDGTRLFTGTLYNPTDQRVPQAQIRVTLLDADNRRMGTASFSVRNIVAQDSTTFREPLDSDKEVSKARVESIVVL